MNTLTVDGFPYNAAEPDHVVTRNALDLQSRVGQIRTAQNGVARNPDLSHEGKAKTTSALTETGETIVVQTYEHYAAPLRRKKDALAQDLYSISLGASGNTPDQAASLTKEIRDVRRGKDGLENRLWVLERARNGDVLSVTAMMVPQVLRPDGIDDDVVAEARDLLAEATNPKDWAQLQEVRGWLAQLDWAKNRALTVVREITGSGRVGSLEQAAMTGPVPVR